LAFYYGQNLFVLAPRGWECSSGEAPSGGRSSLTVTPLDNDGLSGPVIDLESTDSDDNGTFLVTAYGGTYFPKLFTPQDVNTVISELNQRGGNTTMTQFLAPKYPDDRVTYVNDSVLEYRTPPEKMGLGIAVEGGLPGPGFHETPDSSNLLSNLSTYGVVGLVKLPDFPGHYVINLLTIRLPPELAALRPAIQNFTAHCQPFDRQAGCASQINFDGDDQR
jgi:hypothetical protein